MLHFRNYPPGGGEKYRKMPLKEKRMSGGKKKSQALRMIRLLCDIHMASMLSKGSVITWISNPRQCNPKGVGVNKTKIEKSHSGPGICIQTVHLSALVLTIPISIV